MAIQKRYQESSAFSFCFLFSKFKLSPQLTFLVTQSDRYTVMVTHLWHITSSFTGILCSICGSQLLQRMPPSTVYNRLNYQSHKLLSQQVHYTYRSILSAWMQVHVLIFTLQNFNVGLVQSHVFTFFFLLKKKYNGECGPH